MTSDSRFREGDAVLVVDVQNDFCPGGALAIDRGDEVVAPLNRLIAEAVAAGVPVCFSRCWHPDVHPSFKQYGGEWPPHCIQDTEGARFHPELTIPDDAVVVTKGTRFDQDQYSVFDQTGFDDFLKQRNVSRLWVGGLAQDVCVLATVLDARRFGFDVVVFEGATRPVTPEGGAQARTRMLQVGVAVEDS